MIRCVSSGQHWYDYSIGAFGQVRDKIGVYKVCEKCKKKIYIRKFDNKIKPLV